MAVMPPINVVIVEESNVRRIVAEELDAALARYFGNEPAHPVPASAPATLPGLHTTGPIPTSQWVPIPHIDIQVGRYTRRIAVGNPIKVKGLGRGKATGDGYTVQKIEVRNGDLLSDRDPENVNVTVQKGRENPRTVKLDRIVYKRPKARDA